MKRQIELYPAQHDFVTCPDRFTAFVAGIGSGKSYAGAVKGLAQCAKKTLGLVVAPTYPMLRDATWRTYQDVCQGAISVNKSEFIAHIGRSEVLFRSADNPDRLRGPNIHWAHIDEAALCAAGTWEVVIGRLRADRGAGPCWITSTPKGRNWLWQKRDQLTIFRASTEDNPYLSSEFVQSLELAYTGQFAKQELHGDFVAFEGLVYEDFDRNRHVVQKSGPWRHVVAGVDEGYSNPAVILVVGVDGDGRAHVIEEFYRRRVLQGAVVEEARRLQREYRIESFYVDPSAAGLIADMAGSGLIVQAANHEVWPGIQAVKAALAVQGDGQTRLTVGPSCVNMLAEFESYCWKQTRIAGLKDEPEKINDHAMDALRYVIMGITMLQGPLVV